MDLKQLHRMAQRIDREGYDCEDVDALTGAVCALVALVEEAPKFFSLADFDGEKLRWLEAAGLVKAKPAKKKGGV